MPLFGKEESAAFARQPSNNDAGSGVPIKKRRFPVLRSPSPPPEEPTTSLPAKNCSLDKKQFDTSQGASYMDTTAATNMVGEFNTVKNPVLDVKKEVVDPNSNLVGVSCNLVNTRSNLVNTSSVINVSIPKLNGPNLATQSGVNAQLKDVTALPKEPIASVGKNVVGKDATMKCKPEPSTAEFSSGPKEPIIQALLNQKSEQIPASVYPSLSLSISKGKCIDQSKNVDTNVNSETVVSANRSNWDLNTTMDAWEGIGGGEAPRSDALGSCGSSKDGDSLDTSPSLVSQPELGVSVGIGKQIFGDGYCRPNFPAPSVPSTLYKSEDLLNLSLSPSFAQTNVNVKPSSSLASRPFAPTVNMPFAPTIKMPFAPLASGSLVNLQSASSAIVSSSANVTLSANVSSSASVSSSANVTLSASIPRALSSASTNSSLPVDYSKLIGQLVSTNNVTAGNVKSELFDGNSVAAKQDLVATTVNVPSVASKQDLVATTVNVPPVAAKQDLVATTVNVPPVAAKQDLVATTVNDSTVATTVATVNPMGSSINVKKEVVEQCMKNDFVVPNSVSQNVIEERPIKSEPNQESPILSETIMNMSAGMVLMPQNYVSSGLSPSSLLNQEHPAGLFQDKGIIKTCRTEDPNAGENQNSSDDEKINISADMMEDDSFGSDSESNVHATKGTRGGKEDEEYEDGEIRELVQIATVNIPAIEKENFADQGNCETSNLHSLGFVDGVNLNQDPVVECKVVEGKECGDVISEEHIKECVVGVEGNQILDKGVTFQEQLAVDVGPAGPASPEAETSLNASQRKFDGNEDLSIEGIIGDCIGTETEIAGGDLSNENADANENDAREKDYPCLPTADSSLNEQQDASKDTDSVGGRRRIITLSRASDVVSPSKTRSIPDRSFVWGTEKERYTDFEGDKLHLRRNRDDFFTDSPRRFVRDRFQDSFRGSRMKYVRGRGRVYNNRFDRSEWVPSDRKFNTENHNTGSVEYRFSRNEELESDFAQDGDILCSGRGGRKPLGDEFPSFHNPGSRRLSPRGGRGGGPTTRGIQVVRRFVRNISPNGEESSDLVGNRHTDKFTSNDGLDDQFPRGNRKFSLVQRRGLPRIRSKSPLRTRARSPGPWSSPRRRSPDGYSGIPELTRQRRSPPIYRIERVRSPPLNFTDDVVSRRRGSPSYIARPSNNFQRPFMPNRRSPPSGRPMSKNNRKFDNSLDPQERTNSGEYFDGPIRANRYHDEEGSGDDRRKFSGRRGGRGPFRPSFSGGAGSGGENFRHQQEGGPRSFRFGPEGDSEFERSSNLREREFDRRIKNRPVIAPRRVRGVEEQDGDFRQGGPAWHDDNIGDSSRGKRRRF